MRSVSPEPAAGWQHQRPLGALREIPERPARARRPSLARRAGPADLPDRVGAGLEDVGRPDEDDSERVPPDAVAEGGAGIDRAAHGRLLLRRRRGASARLRSAAIEIGTLGSGLRASRYAVTGKSRSITNRNRACASRSADTTTSGCGPRAKMNPR